MQTDLEPRKGTTVLQQLRWVADGSPNPIVVVDEAWKIVLINAQTEKLFGCTPEELIGETVETLPPERHDQVNELLARCKAGENGRNVEGLRWTKTGEVFPVLLSLSLLTDESGTPVATGTTAEVADLLRLNVDTVYALIAKRDLPASKIGGQWRFEQCAIHGCFRNRSIANDSVGTRVSAVHRDTNTPWLDGENA